MKKIKTITKWILPMLTCAFGLTLLVLGFILPDHYRYTGEVRLPTEEAYLEFQNALQDSRVLEWPEWDVKIIDFHPPILLKINVYTSLDYEFPYGEQDTIPALGNVGKALFFGGLGITLTGIGLGLLFNKSYREWIKEGDGYEDRPE